MNGANFDISILLSSSLNDLAIASIVLLIIESRVETLVKSVPNSSLNSFRLDGEGIQ